MSRSARPTARDGWVGRRSIAVAAAAVLYVTAAFVDAATQTNTLLVLGSCLVAAFGVLAMTTRPWWIVAAAATSISISIAVATTAPLPHPPLIEILTLTAALTVLSARARTTSDFAEILLATLALAVIAVRLPATVEFLFLLAAAGVAATGAGMLVRRHARRRHDTIERTRAQERVDLSRDLHDLVAHHVTGIVLVAREARLETDERRVDDMLTVIEGAGSDALRASRRLVSKLRDNARPEDTAPGTEELAALVRGFEASGATASVHAELPDRMLDAPSGDLVVRVVREALTNIQRHAYGTERVEVIVRVTERHVEIAVDDLGVAGLTVPFALGTGTGLLGLRERVEAAGGSLDSRATGRGWQVRALVPVRMDTEEPAPSAPMRRSS